MPAGNTDLLAHIVAAFVRRRVRFIAIGGWAAQSQGYDLGYETEDIDFALQRERGNLDLVSSALTELARRTRLDSTRQKLRFRT